MSWKVKLEGADTLEHGAKAQFEQVVKDEIRAALIRISKHEGGTIKSAEVTTDSHGTEDLTRSVEA